MGLGWSGAYGAIGAGNALADMLKQRELKKQQDFENALKSRGADRADLALQQSGEYQRGENEARMMAKSGTAHSQALAKLQALPPGSSMPSSDPLMTELNGQGLGGPGFFNHDTGTLPSAQLSSDAVSSVGQAAPAVSGHMRFVPGMEPTDTLRGTQQQNVAADKQGNALARQETANAVADERKRNNDLIDAAKGRAQETRNRTEERVDRWGPPTVTISDSESPTKTTVISRNQLPPGGAPGPAPGAVRAQAMTNDATGSQLGRLGDLYKPEYVGPMAGRYNNATKWIPGVEVDPGFAAFAAASAAYENTIIRAITGAAVGVKEAERIKLQIPQITDKSEVWEAKYAQSEKNKADLDNVIAGKKPAATPPPADVPMNRDSIMFQPPPAQPGAGGPATPPIVGRLQAAPPAAATPGRMDGSVADIAQRAQAQQPRSAQNQPNIINGVNYNTFPYRTLPDGRILKAKGGGVFEEMRVVQ